MVTVTLDRERRVGFSWPAIKRLQQETGINFLTMVAEEEDWHLDFTKFSAVVWCGLLDEDPTLTLADVDGLITLPRLGALAQAVRDAVIEAVGEGEQRDPLTPSPSSSG